MGKGCLPKAERTLEVYIGDLGNGNLNETSGATCKLVVSPSWNYFSRKGCFVFRNCLIPTVRLWIVAGE